eukprot:CAMPEP_0113897632 /NCGR_PEP_ID=MMETSP0780_2-20120614/18822_1 /TAXON_ID=652834 /ORGANISM="Palpitomonas bilix" /LENGTH=41 /DNA_ID=CAMNT_0000889187 /DNA_START=64 /DNA_END=185 /DNA_ORIENTATION=+ /assembly_acc=CAM_ASM_000599
MAPPSELPTRAPLAALLAPLLESPPAAARPTTATPPVAPVV